MRLNTITISNVLGLARADIILEPVTLIASGNAQGKSSLADAISMAFLGEPIRVKLKKELGQLLHDGAEKGRVNVTFDGGDHGAEFRLPRGEHLADSVEGGEYLKYVLRTQTFARLSEDDRRTLLFSLTSCKASGKQIVAKLVGRGVPESVVVEFIPNLRNGFPAASKVAYEFAKSAKGEWRGITGQNWGSDVAEGWKAAKPEDSCPTDKYMTELSDYVTTTQAQIEQGLEWIGSQTALLSARESYANRLATQEEIASQLKLRKAKRDATEKDLNLWEIKIPELVKRLEEVRAGVEPIQCPCCDAELRIVDGKLEVFAGLKADAAASSTAALELTKAREAQALMKRTYHNDVQSVAEAESAIKAVTAIKAEAVVKVDINRVETSRLKIEELREGVKTQRAAYNAAQEVRNKYAMLAETTEQATAAHAEVKLWLLIGDSLAPDGIPSELLADALAPFNQSLAVLARLAGWKLAQVNTDMAIEYGGRLYGICSASEQWRADSMIGFAIAQMSTLKMIVLDGIDILEETARVALIKMAMQLVRLTAMETIILCGTLKEIPVNLPKSVGSVWLENSIGERGIQA